MTYWLMKTGEGEETFSSWGDWIDALFERGITNPGRSGYVVTDAGIDLAWGQA